jgi:hypothetical protein
MTNLPWAGRHRCVTLVYPPCHDCLAFVLPVWRVSETAGGVMEAVALNALVIVWISLLLFAPSIAWSLYRHSSAAIFAGGAALTLVTISGVAFVAGLLGFGSLRPLELLAVLLAAVLLGVFVRGTVLLRRRVAPLTVQPNWLAVPLGLLIGVWVLVPPSLLLRRHGLNFGFATIWGADIPFYALLAENIATSGFRDSNHVGNGNLGLFSRDYSYFGPHALMNFVSAATGLPAWQTTFAAMGVEVCLLAVALWALGDAVWRKARFAVAAAVIVACLAGLPTFTYANFYLGGVLGLVGVATSLAGATLVARGPGLEGLFVLGAGGALGVYSYPHLGLPALLLLPFWAVLAAALGETRDRGTLARVAARATAGVLLALLLSAVVLGNAVNLIKLQSQRQTTVPLPLPVLSSLKAVVWPVDIRYDSSMQTVVASWAIVLAVTVFALVAVWRRGLRVSVRLVVALLTASSVVVLGAVAYYGPNRYQAWKMEAFLLPLVIVVTLPALSAWILGTVRVGSMVLVASAGVVLAGPFISWAPTSSQPTPGLITSSGLAALAESPSLSNVKSLNIRLPSAFENMSAGAIITDSAVVFSGISYMPAMTALHTCTLTKRVMLSPGETDFTDLGGGYVLLNRPSTCARRK